MVQFSSWFGDKQVSMHIRTFMNYSMIYGLHVMKNIRLRHTYSFMNLVTRATTWSASRHFA